MTASMITGVVPILITPFDSQGRIDSDSLQSLIDFNINSGVHGIGVANLIFLSAFILDDYAFSTEGIVGYSIGSKDIMYLYSKCHISNQ